MRDNVGKLLKKAAELISSADSIVVAAGAGIGSDSGLPTFRDDNGFWKIYPGLGDANINFKNIANPQAFYEHPRLAWGFYGHRLNLYRNTKPHDGFSILKKWGDSKKYGIFVFTSNVDGQFQKAGFEREFIEECHGSIHNLQCLSPCCQKIWPAHEFNPVVDMNSSILQNDLPVCPFCGGIARPNIMMFNDHEWVCSSGSSYFGKLEPWIQKTKKTVIIEIGAGTVIPSVRVFSSLVKSNFKASLIRINLEPEGFFSFLNKDIYIHLRALDALVKIDQQLDSY